MMAISTFRIKPMEPFLARRSGQEDIVIMKLNTVTLDVVWIRQNGRFDTPEMKPILILPRYGW